MGLGSIRIRVVTSRDEILGLGTEEMAVHLAFRPSDRDLFNLVKTCPGVELLQLPASSYDALSKFIKMYPCLVRHSPGQGRCERPLA